MPDKEKVISAYECVITRGKSVCECGKCDYHIKDSAVFFCDNQRILTDVLALLKEQDAVKPVLDEQTGRMWLCGNCGSYVGFEDHDEYDPNEYDKYCRECGRPVLWEGR